MISAGSEERVEEERVKEERVKEERASFHRVSDKVAGKVLTGWVYVA